jgi:sucrose phosphorylase
LGLTQRDAILITYADQVREPGERPLRTLVEFCSSHAAGLVSAVHLLPFYPSSSDDGFAVMDYRAVDPSLGDWGDVAALGRHFRLMFDAVINHASSQGEWFQAFLRRDPRRSSFFITAAGSADLSSVVRPRTSPLLTKFETGAGPMQVWTTFSADQPDLNYSDPAVLLEVVDILLEYVERGAEFLRLDAVGYLWKQIGTRCIHLPQTHRLVQLFRTVLDMVAPHVLLVTETNVPHAENVSYFGNGNNEAHLVYNFALPPLVLHALLRETGRWLSAWAEGLAVPGRGTAFLNFLASHDGIGLSPLWGLLPEEEIDLLLREVKQRGGLVSFKGGPGGRALAYELNTNFLDALILPGGQEAEATAISRFVTAHAILLALPGVPAIYFHSLFGSRGWPEGAAASGHSRTINREKLSRSQLEADLMDPRSRRAMIHRALGSLLRARAASPAFAPWAGHRVLDCGEGVFGVIRNAEEGPALAVCLHNLTHRPQRVELDWKVIARGVGGPWLDLVTRERAEIGGTPPMTLAPLEFRWLAPSSPWEVEAGSG